MGESMKKQLRTTVHGDDIQAFEMVKKEFEQRTSLPLTDSQVAGKIIRKYLRGETKNQSQPQDNSDN